MAASVVVGVLVVWSGRSFADTPAITSADNATAIAGASFSFTVTTVGTPLPSIKVKGKLPKGVSIANNHDGTASLVGTVRVTTGGVYPRAIGGIYSVTITATFGSGAARQVAAQPFTLTVDQAPTITSRTTSRGRVGAHFSFTVKTRGFPKPTIGESGTLPNGITFTNNGNGMATLAGVPATGSAGTYPMAISASNGVGSPAMQSFTLSIRT